MSDDPRCPQCGAPLPAGSAPQGLCPECLLKAGLEATSGGKSGAPAAAAPSPEEIAKEFPQLEVLSLIGQGGMGAVYRARQRQLGRAVALKILSAQRQDDPAFHERFAREARALATLNHPNIVSIHDFGQTANGRPYFIMELVDGVNLREALRGGHLLPEQALAIVPQICDALQFAHDQGIVHRDIKPENVLLDRAGHVKIADFGIAKILGHEVGSVTLTDTGQTVGTPRYMAPEQIEHPEVVDHRADIFSLGVVFYEMLTGELPMGKFQAPSQRVHVDVRLDEVVLRALEREPERRYQQASEVKTRVRTITQTPPPAEAKRRTGLPPRVEPSGQPDWIEKIKGFWAQGVSILGTRGGSGAGPGDWSEGNYIRGNPLIRDELGLSRRFRSRFVLVVALGVLSLVAATAGWLLRLGLNVEPDLGAGFLARLGHALAAVLSTVAALSGLAFTVGCLLGTADAWARDRDSSRQGELAATTITGRHLIGARTLPWLIALLAKITAGMLIMVVIREISLARGLMVHETFHLPHLPHPRVTPHATAIGLSLWAGAELLGMLGVFATIFLSAALSAIMTRRPIVSAGIGLLAGVGLTSLGWVVGTTAEAFLALLGPIPRLLLWVAIELVVVQFYLLIAWSLWRWLHRAVSTAYQWEASPAAEAASAD